MPFLIAGWSIDYFFTAFAHVKKHFRTLEIVSGLLLVGVGVLLVSNQLALFNTYFGFLNDIVFAAEEMLQ